VIVPRFPSRIYKPISKSKVDIVAHYRGLCKFASLLGLGLLGLPVFQGRVVPVGAIVLGLQERVPEGKEGLGKVGLDAPVLMVNIVVGSIVARDELKRVPGKGVAAVVIYGLDGGKHEEDHALTHVHTGKLV
jgi:hypothetical protein